MLQQKDTSSIKNISDLLRITNLSSKYEQVVTREKLTLENFVKLVEMDQSGLTSTMLKRCKMSCGDFTTLVIAYENSVLGGKPLSKTDYIRDQINKQRQSYGLSSSAASDPFQTPTQGLKCFERD